ncbi:MAG: DNA repair protein RecN [Rectinemataceae bacterium]
MLEELNVRDFALIDKLAVDFTSGFTILSGETGAGKSLLIGAIGFLLGAKADTGIIRTGAEEAVVMGQFDLGGNQAALDWLAAKALPVEDTTLVVRRSLRSNGRGQVLLQGQPVLRSDLGALMNLLVDLHGQHEQQSLLQPDHHRILVDRYAVLEEELREFAGAFSALSRKRKDFESAEMSERERLRELEFLRFSVAEIEAARLRPGELQELETEERMLAQHERLFASIEGAYHILREGEDEHASSTLAALRKARVALDAASEIDPSLSGIAQRLDDAFFELEDISGSLRSYAGSLRFDPGRLEAIEGRLAEIGKLRKKYGDTVEEILSRLEGDRERIGTLSTWEEAKEDLARQIISLESEVQKRALGISERRTLAAKELATRVEALLPPLGMGRARFAINVSRKTLPDGKVSVGPHGMDEVEFLISPNPGEAMRPLARIASGGELSRVALAVKTIFAAEDVASTLIFDEIDSGIGGEIAVAVGEHLEALGEGKQVLCITHLASIAARADNHYRVEKSVDSGRTSTRLVRMEGRARAEEIARMLAGDPREEASIAHATELLRKHGNWRD